MATINVEFEGISDVKKYLKEFGQKVETGLAMAVKASALEINSDVKKRILRGPKTGITYTRGGGQNLSSEHTASAPGEAPANDTGTLVSSIYFEQDGKLSATVGSRLAYAGYLEFGTTRISPRPSWTPATEVARPKLAKRVEEVIRKAAK